MKRKHKGGIHTIAALLVALLATTACGGKRTDEATLQGNISGLDADTLYVYGADPLYTRVDTVPVVGGKFEVALPVDTLVSLYLHFSDGTLYPLFADRGDRISVKGNAAHLQALQVGGNMHNEDLTAFGRQLAALPAALPDTLEARAAAFIKAHPASLASIHLLDKYLVQRPAPDWDKIRRVTEGMEGALKDRAYIANLMQWLRDEDKCATNTTFPYFRLPSVGGKNVTRSQFGSKYLLVHFWASWDDASRRSHAALRKLYDAEKKNEKFAMLGISLDVDAEAWRTAVKADTLKWEQVCDRKGWENDLVKRLCITTLPTRLLIAPNGRIEARDPSDEELERKLADIGQNR